MRIRTAVVATLMLALVAASAFAQKNTSRWSESKYADQGFAISFPGTPSAKSQPVNGNDTATQYLYTLDLGESAYLASVVELGAGNGPEKPDEAYYTRLVKAYAEGSTSKVRSQHAANISGHAGVEAITYNADSSLCSLLDLVAVGDRIYMIVSLGPKGFEASEDAYHFRDSFRLLRAGDHSGDPGHSKGDVDSDSITPTRHTDSDADGNRRGNKWSDFSSVEEFFAAQFPGTPEKKVTPADDEDSPTQYNYQVDLGKRVYMVSVLEFGSAKGPAYPSEDYYSGLVSAYAKGSGSKLRTQSFTKIGGLKAIEAITDSTDSDATYLLDIVCRGDRIYMITSGGPKGHESTPDAQRFRDSFRFLKP